MFRGPLCEPPAFRASFWRDASSQSSSPFLTGNDCYALRCAFLHEGRDDISRQKAKEALERFLFVVPPHGWEIHCNMINGGLQLQVDIFCRDVERGVTEWLSSAESDDRKAREIAGGLVIQHPDPSGGMRF